jgi:hypothetical protein
MIIPFSMSKIAHIACAMIISDKGGESYGTSRRTQEIVSAYNTNDARKIIEARYIGAKIVIWGVTKL